ncbi:MAG TPA: glutathione S-transferase family protein [Verrucomicrobiales bacterium]|nr:glutathione S-transferase family protein [Verrucomicrobiales bacterium]HIL68391.1 glutathione S-transferase family protein [Verrucomicrobiota bacterium]
MIQLFEMLHSPYCIPIALILRNCGQDYESIDVPNWDRSKVIEMTKGNYYQVPVLVHGEKVVYEESNCSLNVARYVDNTFCGGRLFPDQISGSHEVLVDYIEDQLEALSFKLADIVYIDSIRNLSNRIHVLRHKERRFGVACVDQWKVDQDSLRSEFLRELDRFKGTLVQNVFLYGDQPVYADYALYGVLGNYGYFAQNRLSDEQGWLCAWKERLIDTRV